MVFVRYQDVCFFVFLFIIFVCTSAVYTILTIQGLLRSSHNHCRLSGRGGRFLEQFSEQMRKTETNNYKTLQRRSSFKPGTV